MLDIADTLKINIKSILKENIDLCIKNLKKKINQIKYSYAWIWFEYNDDSILKQILIKKIDKMFEKRNKKN
jgi:hypothetical protein